MADNTVAVIGAGIVGVACALELQRHGLNVTLLDRTGPGRETSYGNSGVLAPSSLMPFNRPGLWASLPRLLRNRSAQLRYEPSYLARNAGWALGFLAHARSKPFEQTASALDGLIRLSMAEHRRLLHEAGETRRLRETGWLFLYRGKASFDASRFARETLRRYGVAIDEIDTAGIAELEPDLAPVFSNAIWIKDALSVDNPGRVVEAYAAMFASRGGTVAQRDIATIRRVRDGWELHDANGAAINVSRIVVALGPWSKPFLERLGLSVSMAYERGYHMHFASLNGAKLSRPIYDTGGGYILSPMEQGLRMTTGIELAGLDAPKNLAQLELAEASLRQAFPLGNRLQDEPWLGRRPTFPDSRPVIGEAPGHPGLWLAFGHQHIGFCTGTGTASVLAALMLRQKPMIDPAPFSAFRFVS